ncbi:unnamed protein product [Amoebophrya sp. A25]|nr:unnamed protein product [Amoebophrya sp. A25]|eukprot:GSA25T00025561001.1
MMNGASSSSSSSKVPQQKGDPRFPSLGLFPACTPEEGVGKLEECHGHWVMVNQVLVSKFKKDRKSIHINDAIGGIPLLHLICKVGSCRYHGHSGPDSRPQEQISSRNKLLEAVLLDNYLDVNALDRHGQSALNYCFSYTYERGDAADADGTTTEGYLLVLNWVNCRMLLNHPNFCCLDFPTPGGCFFNMQLDEMMKRAYQLYTSPMVKKLYAPAKISGMSKTLNFCGTEIDRARRTRVFSAAAVTDSNNYACTLLTRVVTKHFGGGVNLLLREPAEERLVSQIWKHPAFKRSKFVDEVFAPSEELRWRDVELKDREKYRSYVNCTPKAWDFLVDAIAWHKSREAAGEFENDQDDGAQTFDPMTAPQQLISFGPPATSSTINNRERSMTTPGGAANTIMKQAAGSSTVAAQPAPPKLQINFAGATSSTAVQQKRASRKVEVSPVHVKMLKRATEQSPSPNISELLVDERAAASKATKSSTTMKSVVRGGSKPSSSSGGASKAVTATKTAAGQKPPVASIPKTSVPWKPSRLVKSMKLEAAPTMKEAAPAKSTKAKLAATSSKQGSTTTTTTKHVAASPRASKMKASPSPGGAMKASGSRKGATKATASPKGAKKKEATSPKGAMKKVATSPKGAGRKVAASPKGAKKKVAASPKGAMKKFSAFSSSTTKKGRPLLKSKIPAMKQVKKGAGAKKGARKGK